jgi:hypothetical protein
MFLRFTGFAACANRVSASQAGREPAIETSIEFEINERREIAIGHSRFKSEYLDTTSYSGLRNFTWID